MQSSTETPVQWPSAPVLVGLVPLPFLSRRWSTQDMHWNPERKAFLARNLTLSSSNTHNGPSEGDGVPAPHCFRPIEALKCSRIVKRPPQRSRGLAECCVSKVLYCSLQNSSAKNV